MNKNKFWFCKELNQNIKFIKIFLWAWIFSGFILLVDIYNIPSSMINKIPIEAEIIFISILVVASILICYHGHFWDLCKFPQVNIIDTANVCFMCVISKLFYWQKAIY